MSQAQSQQPSAEYAEGAPSTDMTFWALMQGSVQFRNETVQSEDRILAFLDFPDIVASIEAAFPGNLSAGDRVQQARRLIAEARLYVALADPKKAKPALLACTVESMVQAIGNCASTDLSFNKALSQCYINPYGTCATFAIMAQGFIELIHRASGILVSVGIVYKSELDTFQPRPGEPISYIERPQCPREDSDIVVWWAETSTRPPMHEFLNRDQAEKIKRCSKNPGGVPTQWYGEWGKAKVLRRLAKQLPKGQNPAATLAMSRALELDNRDYDLDRAQAEQTVRATGRELLAKAKTAQVVDVPPEAPLEAAGAPTAEGGPTAAPPPATPSEALLARLYALVAQVRKGETDVPDKTFIDQAAKQLFGLPLEALSADQVTSLGKAIKAGAFDPATGDRFP
jgi:recombinational DNA repair protein RecT